VFTHELVRHRVGTAFSQTSGRYVRTDQLEFVLDPILEPVRNDVLEVMEMLEGRRDYIARKLGIDQQTSFEQKKRMTSALRRILPDGRGNEIGWSANARTIRHLLMLRTSRHAEWEIRTVFCQVFELLKPKFGMLLHDAKLEYDPHDGLPGLFEIKGMRTQPYE
jgi:thymidylate synthase (FAD)